MTIETRLFNAAEYLTSPEAQAEFLRDALETADAGYIANACGVIRTLNSHHDANAAQTEQAR